VDNLEKKINKLRNLKQNKDKTDEQLELLAKEDLEKKDVISSLTFCKDDKEREFAIDLLERYTKENSIESEADKDTLRQLIDMEILAERFKYLLKIEYEKANPAIPLNMVEELRETEKQVLELKNTLGLTNKDKNNQTWLQDWKNLEKKCLNYYREHAAETYTRCPRCQHMYRLLMRVDNKEKVSATFFKKTKLYNHKLFSLYHEKRLTDVEVAEILGVSVQYINYMYSELFLMEKKEGL
jgi:hypothetical protein